MTRKQRRLTLIGSAGAVLAVALGLVLVAMKDSIVFFYAPAEVAAKGIAAGTRFRLGGLVEEGSVKRGDGEIVAFTIKDGERAIPVRYKGTLPDLFREGQGVVTEGVLEADGAFRADTVLAKHDETYMPREVADALRRQGHWQGEQNSPQPAKQ